MNKTMKNEGIKFMINKGTIKCPPPEKLNQKFFNTQNISNELQMLSDKLIGPHTSKDFKAPLDAVLKDNQTEKSRSASCNSEVILSMEIKSVSDKSK